MHQGFAVELVVPRQIAAKALQLERQGLETPCFVGLGFEAGVGKRRLPPAGEKCGAQRIGYRKRLAGLPNESSQPGVLRHALLDTGHGRTVVDAATIPAMVRVFVEQGAIAEGRLRLGGDDARHLGGALRMRPGEELVAVTPDGVEHRCEVISASAREVEAAVLGSAPSHREPSLRVRLAQALLKGDQFDRILEYAAELGVESIQPLLTERTVARPEPKKLVARLDRWRQIVRQGAELGQRGRLPEVLPVASPSEATAAAVAAGFRVFLLYEGTGLSSLSEADLGDGGVCLMAGPEGGWSEAEVKLARASGAAIVSLGPRIMRPLPAVLTAIGALYHRTGDLQLKED